MEPAIETDGLTRSFGPLTAVDNLNLNVPAGTLFGFLGPNGAGKTTTIHLLLGILPPTAGTARVFGLDATRQGDAVRAKCGALLEHHGLYERMSAQANLEYAGRINRLHPTERRDRIREGLESIGLWDRRKEIVGKWSRGMKQKLAIARALLHRPPLAFLDEPTAGHDPEGQHELREFLSRAVKREGMTVFLTTHNLREAEALCNRVAILRKGRLAAVGRPDDLQRRSSHPRLELIGGNFTGQFLTAVQQLADVKTCQQVDGRVVVDLGHEDVSSDPIVRLAVKHKVRVEEVQRHRPTLEEAYLALGETRRA